MSGKLMEGAPGEGIVTNRENEITEIEKELKDGWAGHGSVAPSPKTIRNARSLLGMLKLTFNTVTATDYGTIMIESALRTSPRATDTYQMVEVGNEKVSMVVGSGEEKLYINGTLSRAADNKPLSKIDPTAEEAVRTYMGTWRGGSDVDFYAGIVEAVRAVSS